MCFWYSMNDVGLGHHYSWWRGEFSSSVACDVHNPNIYQNLFPVQIENVLTAHPSIREAAAVAVPDVKFGEVVGAWVALEPGTTMSKERVRQVVRDNMNPQVRIDLLVSRYYLSY